MLSFQRNGSHFLIPLSHPVQQNRSIIHTHLSRKRQFLCRLFRQFCQETVYQIQSPVAFSLPAPCFLRGMLANSKTFAFDEIEQQAEIGYINCTPAKFFLEGRILQNKQILQVKNPGRLKIGITSHKLFQFLQALLIQMFRMLDPFLQMLFCHGLPVCYGRIEYLLNNLVDHLIDQFFLHGRKLLAGIIFTAG